ncbi:GspMb/PilO family protein [Chitinimonas sp. BJYL2]|uniref:GspMb/PilO family protein n=1 Tax=Chitinimonas sp. BJYL2 TaxID=2976696 RepID=UPI0022B310B8|nr:GspMb/PilO family protein [Chitinimonas sp. BJYL2]
MLPQFSFAVFSLCQTTRKHLAWSVFGGVMVVIAVMLSVSYAQQKQALANLSMELTSPTATSVPIASSAYQPTQSALPAFNSAQLAKTLGDQASKLKLDLSEVNYTLDETSGLPYLRYRVTLTLDASYPNIRRYVAALQVAVPNLSLDGIHCNREDIGDKPLSCDLTLSAVYQRGAHG